MFKKVSSDIIKKNLFVLLFLIFLFPYSIDINSDKVSINYLFITFPLFLIIINNKIYKPNIKIFFLLFIYIFLLVFNLIYEINDTHFFVRKFLSFLVFISIFVFIFIKITQYWIDCFKFSIVFFSILMSLYSFYNFFFIYEDLHFGLKETIGSQILGFVYIFGIWINFFLNYVKKYLFVKYFITIVILFGLLNLFTKAAIITLILSFFFYLFINVKKIFSYKNFFFFILFFIFIGIIIYLFFFNTIEKYYLFYSYQFQSITFSNPLSSESERLKLFLNVFKNLDLINFFFGSGYLGIWMLDENIKNNSHNQYLDVFFRTGTIGLLCYFYLIYLILKSLKKNNLGLFYGFVSILIYSLFINTFKLSHGAFILSFLIGICNDDLRFNNYNHRN
jgi:O-antigen ligase